MAFINYSAREINCKLVYYGPGLCGKTTNLKYIYEKTAAYGHFGREEPEFTWERTDKAAALKAAAGL